MLAHTFRSFVRIAIPATGRVYPHTFLHRFDAATEELALENDPRDLFTEQNFQKFSQMCVWTDGRIRLCQ